MRFRSLIPLALAVVALAAPAAQSQETANYHRVLDSAVAQPDTSYTLTATSSALLTYMTIEASTSTKTLPNLPANDSKPFGALSLSGSAIGLAAIGATAAAGGEGRRETLSQSYLFQGNTYGPGRNILVPDDFPELDDDGNVVHEAGSVAERNAARSRQAPFPSGTAPLAEDGSDNVSGKTVDELEAMKVEELTELADTLGLEVIRSDGEGEPLKADFVTALSAPAHE